jgi:hypothetical protein
MNASVGFRWQSIFGAAWVLLFLCTGCSLKVQKKALYVPDELAAQQGLDGRSPWLKAHLPDGGLYLLSDWRVNEERREIVGVGTRLNARREVLDTGPFAVALDSVSIFESNTVQTSSAVAGLTVLTVASAGMTVYCLANPKACFGSCPTFYAANEAGEPLLMAEGFSASVSPSLEDSDVDALFRTTASKREFTLTMTNEALETHVVRRADLLVLPRPEGGRILAAQDGSWWQAEQLIPVASCRGPEGDCTELVASCDARERFSLADSLYLGTKEFLELEFEHVPEGELGLVIASRHTLLSTFLFYQGLAYLGENAVPALARLDGASQSESGSETMGHLLGKIEVQVPGPDGTWVSVGSTGETGPLAVNVHTLRLPALNPADTRMRLKLTKGNWRLDYVALAALDRPVTPVRIAPTMVLRDSVPDSAALADLIDDNRTLISLPGDRFELSYELPDFDRDCDVFVESRGYYLEWMRNEWLAEEDPAKAALMFLRPKLALSYLAPKFKALEPDMEAQFWGSRYAR